MVLKTKRIEAGHYLYVEPSTGTKFTIRRFTESDGYDETFWTWTMEGGDMQGMYPTKLEVLIDLEKNISGSGYIAHELRLKRSVKIILSRLYPD